MSWRKPTPWQEDVLSVPEHVSLLLAGGRGPGKTTAASMDIIRHCTKYAGKARVLVVRETLKSLSEFEDELQAALVAAFGRGIKANRQEHTFRLSNGATVECAPLESPSDYAKLQGRSFSLVVADEVGNFRTLKWLDMLRSNLRAPSGVPTRFIWCANPGGRMHRALQVRFIQRAAPWSIFEVDGRQWCVCFGTLGDNPHLPADYEQDLLAACGRDRELFRAWKDGSWNISRGAYFADVIDEARQKLPADNYTSLTSHECASTFVACDWGISSPAVAFACVRARGPLGPYPSGSLILLDEVSSADPEDYSIGLQWAPGRLADAINDMCERCDVSRHGCIDDARGLGSDETLINTMQRYELWFERPAKGRREGWAALRELMFNSQQRNGRPGLWVSERCRGFWATVPECPRDPLHPEELDTAAVDHWADAARYAATFWPAVVTFGHYIT